MLVFRADVADPAAYEIEKQQIRGQPPDDGDRVIWRPADAVDPPFYPNGIAELVAGS